MNKLNILKFSEVFKSELIKKVGIRSEMTDLAILTGEDDINNMSHSRGSYWIDYNGVPGIVNPCGFLKNDLNYLPNTGIRPVLLEDELEECYLAISSQVDKMLILKHGEYPQDIVEDNISHTLEFLYNSNCLDNTGKNYTLHYNQDSLSVTNKEYLYDKKKYVRYEDDNKVYWLEVKPIEWYYDNELNALISKKILLKGIDYNQTNFDNSTLKYFMDNYMSNDIFNNVFKKEYNGNVKTKKL